MEKAELDLKAGASGDLLNETRSLIQDARLQAVTAVNIGLTLLYWRLGDRIRREVLDS